MSKNIADEIKRAAGLEVYETSLVEAEGVTYFFAHGRPDQLRRTLATEKVVGSIGKGRVSGVSIGEVGGKDVIAGETNHANAEGIRKALPWTAPRCLGLAPSVGLGDRLGLATAGHVRAVRGSGLAPVFAQQSIREMARTRRTPEQVMDCATWGVLQEGWREGFGADADHLQEPKDIDATVAAGFTMFTIDPGAHVDNEADEDPSARLADKVADIPLPEMDIEAADVTSQYIGQTFDVGETKIFFSEVTLLRAAAKYGRAIVHAARMHRHLKQVATGPFELEISVDETESPTTPAEHFFFARELKRLGVEWVSMAPRFVGRFEKGVDYIGDLDEFRATFAQHVAVMRALGPYKLSIHSGSDKFSIYPIVADLAGPHVHLKTAGTSYLEAVRAIAATEPDLFREILDFARARYETDKATYHVSADVSKVPAAESLSDDELPALLDQFDARQALHVTFGSVLTAGGGGKFRDRILAALNSDEEAHYRVLEKHLRRHVAPFAAK